jgi:two-component system, LytTR family, sensor kinase
MQHPLLLQIIVILFSTVLLGLAILFLSIYNRLFLGIKSLWFRKNLLVLCIAILIMTALLALQSPEMFAKGSNKGPWGLLIKQLGLTELIVFFVFNVVWAISRFQIIKRLSFIKHHIVIVLTIVVAALVIYSIINYVDNGMHFKNLHATLVFAYYNALLTGLIYTAVSYVDLERKRKLDEKELELTKLVALKTKAELDALHSKINPHFLYNALNSIADLAITDGKKGRKMTIALADLFRYSINYSNHNYSSVKDEVEMAEVYLQIEKIRFEDQLSYSVKTDPALHNYLLPRFILQPIVENAVKHGLKTTGKMTEIHIEVERYEDGLILIVADNGPLFPTELSPGYGVKSIFDKLDLLFHNQYEVRFTNSPQKQVTVYIQKLMKDEPVI